jgi:uncharacterized membrane protein
LARFVFIALVGLSNALMWLLFTSALAKAPSSIQVTTVNSAANMIMTGLLSLWLFNEELPLNWWVGAAFVILGSMYLNKELSPTPEKKKVK